MSASPAGLLDHLRSYTARRKLDRKGRKSRAQPSRARESSGLTSSRSLGSSQRSYVDSPTKAPRPFSFACSVTSSHSGSDSGSSDLASQLPIEPVQPHPSTIQAKSWASSPDHEASLAVLSSVMISKQTMPHHGSVSNPYAVAVRQPKLYSLDSKSPTNSTYQAYTPPRTNSGDADTPSWTSMPDQHNQNRTANAQTSSASTRRGSVPVPYHRTDIVSRHLLVQTALLDSENFEQISIEELDALKKEKAQLDVRLNASRKKLAMESKVRDAAQSLHRLYTDADEEPSSTSVQKKRSSILGDRARSVSGNHKKTTSQAQEELATSQSKIHELLHILSGLENRRQYVESRLLRHTSAVLQSAHQEQLEQAESQARQEANRRVTTIDTGDGDRNLLDSAIDGLLNGSGYEESIYSRSSRSANALADGAGNPNPRLDKISSDRMMSLQTRLDSMNRQLRSLIQLARREKTSPDKEDLEARPASRTGDPLAHLDTQVDLMDKNMSRLEQECAKGVDVQRDAERSLAEINKRLFLLMQVADISEAAVDLGVPPVSTSQGTQIHLDYLSQVMDVLDTVLQGHNGATALELEEAKAKIASIEAALHGLWEALTMSSEKGEPFSLAAFSTRVQHLLEKSSHSESQLDILRRQIQQQRELNSKSDGERDKQVAQLQSTQANLEAELGRLRERHVSAEAETQGARAELEKVMGELDALRTTHEHHERQKIAVLEQVSNLRDEAHATSTERDAKQAEAEKLEAEVVRLTTELASAKAEIDAAHGSRAERAAEQDAQAQSARAATGKEAAAAAAAATAATAAEIADLRQELAGMAGECHELTKESVETEKEREALEGTVDGLRAKVETLETQLAEERVGRLGLGEGAGGMGAGADGVEAAAGGGMRENTSATVLRSEFRKLMRETRAEHARALKIEQEERKRLEASLRGLRKASMASSRTTGTGTS